MSRYANMSMDMEDDAWTMFLDADTPEEVVKKETERLENGDYTVISVERTKEHVCISYVRDSDLYSSVTRGF